MNGKSGKTWLRLGASAETAFDRTGLPILLHPSEVGPNDCIVWIDEGGQSPAEESFMRTKAATASTTSTTSAVSPWLMNASGASILRLKKEELERRLRREGLPARIGSTSTGGSSISVAIWGREAVEIRRNRSGGQMINRINHRRIDEDIDLLSPSHGLWKPLERLSARALYVLGLDFGQVEAQEDEKGQLYVKALTPYLKLISREGESRLRDRVKAFARDWAYESSRPLRAKLGADPEFVLLSEAGRVVPATRFFRPDDDAGCDSVRVQGEKRWPLVELRPRPTTDPVHLTADVRRLLGIAAERTAGVRLTWRAGAMPIPGLPLGGHVHLSGVALTGERLRALDNAVALPLRLLEPPAAGKRRPRYGSLGDVRRQSHGGFEYRTPPSWLVSPRLALGAFALAKVAAEHSRELAGHRPLDEERYRDAFYDGDRELLLQAAARVYRAIKLTEGYGKYREPIDFVFASIARNRNWDEQTDIRHKWRIPVK